MPKPSGWKIIIHRRAEKALARLPKDLLERIRQAINGLAMNPRLDGCKKLVGYENLYRVRVGDWRISYAVETDRLIILVLEISSRGGAYKNL